MGPESSSRTGRLTVLGYQLYYRIFEPPTPKGTLLALHGGPGMSHSYLLPLADLCDFGYRVVFFDQLGCGDSELPSDNSLFSIEHNIEEVEGIRQGLDLGTVHLLGSSYGGLLALAYGLRYQSHLKSITTTGGLTDVPLTVAEMNRLKSELPAEIRTTLERYERKGEYHHPEYEAAVMEFYRRHVCRLPTWPAEVVDTFRRVSTPVYYHMNGPNEFIITGTIKDVNFTSELHRIRIPCLVTTATFDEVTPKVAEEIHRAIPQSRLVLFEGCSHLPMWEDRGRYCHTLAEFLDRVN